MKNTYSGIKIKRVTADENQPLLLICRARRRAVFILLVSASVVLLFAPIAEDLLPDHAFGGNVAWLSEYLPLAMLALSAYLALRCLQVMTARTLIHIDGQTVSVSRPLRPFQRNWSEPLSNYEGVRWNRFAIHDRRTDNQTTTRYRHVIELIHPDADRTVPLFLSETKAISPEAILAHARMAASASTTGFAGDDEVEAYAERFRDQVSGGNPRARWEEFAARLGIPAIDARDGSYEIREAEDLDKSLRQRSEEGKVESTWQNTPPPQTLSVERRGSPDDPASQQLHVTVHAIQLPLVLLYAFGGIGIVLLTVGLFTRNIGPILGGVLFGGAGYGIWYLQRNNPCELIVTREEIRYRDPLVSSRSFVMPLSEVESIKMRERDTESANSRKTLKLSGKELLISSDSMEGAVGGGLNDEALDWLRGCLMAAVTEPRAQW